MSSPIFDVAHCMRRTVLIAAIALASHPVTPRAQEVAVFGDGFEPRCFYDPNQPFRELILDAGGAIDPNAYRCVAEHFNRADIVDWRLGPKERHFHVQPQTLPTVHTPVADGSGWWPFGTQPPSNPGEPNKCPPAGGLPVSDQDEIARGLRGNAWLIGGQYAFVPDAGVAAPFRIGLSNLKTADGLVYDTGGLCMRMSASWTPDWWVRNSTAAAATPEAAALVASAPSTPLPPVALARAKANVGQLAFAAFANGRIIPVRVGNSDFENDFTAGVQLPPGLVPTALAVSAYNEFLFVTVWDTNALAGRLGVIALRPRQMAVGSPSQTPNVRYYWGLPGAWTVTGMKLLGFVDLPFAAPTSLDVYSNVSQGNPRGFGDNDAPDVGDLSRQVARDRWFGTDWNTRFGPNYWQQSAQFGYAVVASRAENRVAFVDLRPLFAFYRSQYLTTAQNFAQTTTAAWPFDFAQRPEQRPTVAASFEVAQPTAVRSGQDTNTLFGLSRSDSYTEGTPGGDAQSPRFTARRRAYVALMEGRVQMFDVSSLIRPAVDACGCNNPPPVQPLAPIGSFVVGRNPVAFGLTGPLATAPDDLFVISRGDRSITYAFPDGAVQGVLRDQRLVDPVGATIAINQAGFGGLGAGRAVLAMAITVTDFDGRALAVYAVDARRNNPEQYPFTSPAGPVLFLFGNRATTPGRPFLVNDIEII